MRDPLRQTIGRLGAVRWSQEDAHDPNRPLPRARASFLARFEREVDPDGVLDPAERARRAEHAETAHFTRMALASAKARRKKAANRDDMSKRPPLAVTLLTITTAPLLLAVAVGLVRGISEAVIAAVAGLVAATTALVRVLLGFNGR
jgi:hypothetical protein